MQQNQNPEVFIGSLNFQATEDDIKEFFKKCGKVTYVKLLRNPDGTSKGRGFVKFDTEEAINKAVLLNNQDMMGRQIKVEIPRNQSDQQNGQPNNKTSFINRIQNENKGEESTNVIVRNLPFTFDENNLSQLFEGCGDIVRVRIIKGEDGNSRGFGFVDFSSVEFARVAINKSGEKVNGRPIHVDYSIPREKRDQGQGQGNRGGY